MIDLSTINLNTITLNMIDHSMIDRSMIDHSLDQPELRGHERDYPNLSSVRLINPQ